MREVVELNLKELSQEVAEREGISAWKVKSIINTMMDVINEQLRAGKYVYIQRLGKIMMRAKSWQYTVKGGKWWNRNKTAIGITRVPCIKLSKRLRREIKRGK